MASFTTLQSIGPVRSGHELDVKGLNVYLKQQLPDFFRGAQGGQELKVLQFSHGQSNPTFLLVLPWSGQNLVLRKKPPGKLLASAHAVEREYTVIAALSPTGFPVPKPVHLCTSQQPLGTPFYLMECSEGRIFLDPNLPELQPQQRTEIYQHMAKVLASLHSLDPTSIGLRGYGNPDAYCARQLRRWTDQYRASVPVPDPAVLRLIAWLADHVPSSDARPPRPAVVHGDYRLDNIVFGDGSRGGMGGGGGGVRGGHQPLAVLDWELSTLGNPWADVAYNCLPYHLPAGLSALQRLRPEGPSGALPAGIPSEPEYLAWYCAAAGVAPPPPSDWAFYLALSLFRLLAILAGVQARARQGNASSANAARVASDEVLRALAGAALGIIERAEAAGSAAPAAGGCRCGLKTCTCDSEHAAGAGGKCGCSGCTAKKGKEAGGTAAAASAAAAAGPAPTTTASGEDADGGGGGGGGGGLLGLSPRAAALRAKLEAFMRDHVYPAEEVLEAHAMGPQESRWTVHPLMEDLKRRAKRAGLWNLWLPGSLAAKVAWLADHLRATEEGSVAGGAGGGGGGCTCSACTCSPCTCGAPAAAAAGSAGGGGCTCSPCSCSPCTCGAAAAAASAPPRDSDVLLGAGLSNLEYAHLCELMGRSAWAPEVFNCSAPDTGNMEVLAKYGSREQQLTWLLPLLRGSIRSCFAMTEKAVASSDATNITSTIGRSGCGGFYTVTGVKWWTSGAMDPRCKIAIFMGKTDPRAAPHRQQSMVLVPMDAPGVRVVRPMLVFGYDDAPHGHAEVHFTDVRVPASNLILGEGRGFEIAQGRLGPGRLHHCMRLVGAGERAIELMARRAAERRVFGGPLAAQGAFKAQLARCRIDVDGARLLVLAAADSLDRHGFKGAAAAIAAAKVEAPNAVLRVIDAAIQAHGGAGVSQDFVLARLWTAARTLRIADGPDEVHLGTIAKLEMKRLGLGKAAKL